MGGKGTNGAYANQIRVLWEARAAGTPVRGPLGRFC